MEMAKVYDMLAIMSELYKDVATPQEVPAGSQWPPMTLTALRTLPSAAMGSVLPVELAWEGPFDGARVSLRLILWTARSSRRWTTGWSR